MTPAGSDEQDVRAVTVHDFTRAETDTYFASFAKQGAFGIFVHSRALTPIAEQTVIRMNRDTLYSTAVFDLEAGPVTVTLPDAGDRYLAMQVIDQDHYSPFVIYKPGAHTLTREQIGTRYVACLVRILVDPGDPADPPKVHALQDAIHVEQAAAGRFDAPSWDQDGLAKLRDALKVLGAAEGSNPRRFGRKEDVDPIDHLIGTAIGWGGNPTADATYAGVVPPQNDGETVHRLTVKDVPVDGFWSISVYNEAGFFEPNARNAYTLNNLTAAPDEDGSITIQFGGCDGTVRNCLPICPGWNYLVRLYRPRPEILDGSWRFPEAQPVR
jgi:hypothetical protein